MTPTPNRWADLRPRMLSAAVMASVGAVEIWVGGWTFSVLIILLIALMLWELGAMTRPPAVQRASRMPQTRNAAALGILGGFCLAISL